MILAINSGSSSLKFGIFAEQDGDEHALLSGNADAIGKDNGSLTIHDAEGKKVHDETQHFASQKEALSHVAKTLAALGYETPEAVGHRIVHGGPHLVTHVRITDEVIAMLEQAVHFAPLHIPPAVELIRHAQKTYPSVPQFACFDTAFHQTMPEAAYRYSIPEKYFQEGVRRYGFHGLSYASIVHALGADLPKRAVIAHLGSGASLAAVLDGKSIDTSMGMTPTGGIPMGTRTGDLDPGVPLFLMRTKNLDADKIEALMNHDSGLKALGGVNDMRVLEKSASGGDKNAALAIEIFCRSIAKTIASYAVVLGGLDMLIFAGGIGEHSAEVRANVCNRLALLGLQVDEAPNQSSKTAISSGKSSIVVRIIPSEEEKQIARHCRALLRPSRP